MYLRSCDESILSSSKLHVIQQHLEINVKFTCKNVRLPHKLATIHRANGGKRLSNYSKTINAEETETKEVQVRDGGGFLNLIITVFNLEGQ
jgi:hypothetical protein